MKLDPKLFKMEAKVWRDPVAEKKAIEEQNRKRAEAKKKADEDKLARKVKAEREKLERKQLAETGRLVQNEKTDQYLARLKVDVARLEAKRDADKAVSNKSSGNPGAEDPKTSAGTTLTAAEIKLRQEVEFERKKRENPNLRRDWPSYGSHTRLQAPSRPSKSASPTSSFADTKNLVS
ncbi:hypothetical protein JCM10212_005566 [Sporobolomyces blumeae]